jgi:signal peptidase I
MTWRESRQRGRVRREGATLVRHVRRTLRKAGFRVDKDKLPVIAAACDRLELAVKSGDHDAICAGLVELDELSERHLYFARRGAVREYADSIGVALLVALLLRTFVVEAFKIPSGSMIPTMEVGDHIFVNKFLYGLRIPFTSIKLLDFRKPERGEVIVFIYPREPWKDFIKRVVAVAGDRIEVHDDIVYVNGEPVPHQPLDAGLYRYWDFNEHTERWEVKYAERYEERLGSNRFRTLVNPDSHSMDFPTPNDPDPYIVPEGRVFVLGDNRSTSLDSRYWGTVPLENIKGKAMIVWWSQGQPEGVRIDRIGKAVE